MQKLSVDVLDFLNQIIGQAHKVLYSFPPVNSAGFRTFFKITLPSIFIKNIVFFIISAVVFLSSYTASMFAVINNPQVANVLVPKAVLTELKESYKKGIDTERILPMKSYMISFYIYNNVSIAFTCFVLGIFAGIGTIYILFQNGIMIGAISGYIISQGYGKNFINFVTAHSAAELTGIIASGAAGLMLGYNVIRATRYRRRDELIRNKDTIFMVLVASSILLLVAAFIEGLFSPGLLPYPFKLFMLIVTSVLFIFSFIQLFPE